MRRLTMADIAALPPLAMLPTGDDEWSLVYPIGVDLSIGAVAIGRIFDYVCSPQ